MTKKVKFLKKEPEVKVKEDQLDLKDVFEKASTLSHKDIVSKVSPDYREIWLRDEKVATGF